MSLCKLFFFFFMSIIFGNAESAFSQGVLNVYLSPKGNDVNIGTKYSPLLSLEGAKKAIQKSFKEKSYDEVNVLLISGTYMLNEEVRFDSALFKSKEVKFTIKSYGKKKANISGGKRIPTSMFKRVGRDYYNRLHKDAAGKVYVADLKGNDAAKTFNILGKEGQSYKNQSGNLILPPKSSDYSLLTWNKYSLQIAQWPNRGYSHIKEVTDKGPTTRWLKPKEKPASYSLEHPTGGSFTTVEQTDWKKWDAEFKANGQVVVQGYLDNDWYYQNEIVGRVNNGEIKLLHHTRYGIVAHKHMLPRRVRVVNLLCELDQPGEWYFDIESQKLYLWPIAALKSSVNISVAGGGKMMCLDHLSNVTIQNLVFQNGGEMAIEINGGDKNLVAGCGFFNFVKKGVSINGGKNNGIEACEFKGLMSAASISGGDRTTLEPCNSYFINNEISECRLKGYGVVGLQGVGIECSHNLFHAMNGALIFKGNDITIEYNEFYDMGWEMGDWNAAYTGADWASFGNKFQYNFIHHLMEMPGAYPVEGVRNDDSGMGVAFVGNVFYKSGRGSIAFSGAGNDCKNNIALETPTVWQTFYASKDISKVRAAWEKRRAYDDGKLIRGDKDDNLWRAEQCYGKMGWLFDPYKTKYPTLKKIMNDGNPFAPSYGVIKNNYVQESMIATSGSKKRGLYMHGCTVDDLPLTTEWEYPRPVSMDDFVDPSVLNFKMKDEFHPMEGFEKIPFEKIGLFIDEYRSSMPNKDKYRKAIKERYDGIKSNGGRYDMKTAFKRYPLPDYLK